MIASPREADTDGDAGVSVGKLDGDEFGIGPGPTKPGRRRRYRCLELFGGDRAWSRALRRRGCRVVSVDLHADSHPDDVARDLSNKSCAQTWCQDIRDGRFDGFHLGTPCGALVF
jgi:hypothetical protein